MSVKNRSLVLVVDDDLDIRETLRDVAEAEGFAVATASDGREAMERLQRGPAPHLVLLDLMMPVMSGWEVLRAMRSDRALSSVPVVVISAVGSKMDLFGASAFLCKPIDLDILLATLHQHCGEPREVPSLRSGARFEIDDSPSYS
jgi:CheY-like chemotaxis protein